MTQHLGPGHPKEWRDGKQSECEDCRIYQIKKRRRVPGAEATK